MRSTIFSFSRISKGLFLLGLIFTTSCAPSSMEEFRKEGESVCRKFTEELQKIESREDLAKALPQIKKRYDEIADLMIEVNKFKDEHFGEATDSWYSSDNLVSEALMLEIKRIYRLEGGREFMEEAQKESLFRLDAVLRKARRNARG